MTDVATTFEQCRPRLLRVAYGILGSIGEAEDVVQDAWLRLARADPEAIENLPAWLTTVVGRLALDALGGARHRREPTSASGCRSRWSPPPTPTRRSTRR